jgi:hypothetical protein
MSLNEFLWEIFSILLVTAVVVVLTLHYQKKMRR